MLDKSKPKELKTLILPKIKNKALITKNTNTNNAKNIRLIINTSLNKSNNSRNTNKNSPRTINNLTINQTIGTIDDSDYLYDNYKQLEPLEDYAQNIQNSMSSYIMDPNNLILKDPNNPFTNKIMRKIGYYMDKKLYRSNNNPMLDSSIIQVKVNDYQYHTLSESCKIISQNKIIHDEILLKMINRQKMKYKEAINKIEKNQQLKVDMPKIKVTRSAPKANFLTNLNNTNDEITNAIMGKNKKAELDNYKENKADGRLPLTSENKLKLFYYYLYPLRNFPEGREQFCLAYNFTEIILFGGMASNKNNNVWRLNPGIFINFTLLDKLEWIKLESMNMPAHPRYGHSGILYENKLFIFGGKTKVQNYNFLADLEIYDIESNQWEIPSLFTKSILKLRRNHIAELIGQHMFIHGGFDENNEVLDDCYLLTLNPLKWTLINLNDDQPKPKLAGHTCCLVVPEDIKFNYRFHIYKYPEQAISKRVTSRIKERGLYIFGGKSSEFGELKNDVWILKLGKKILEWTKITTSGKPPTPRYFHSMNFYEDGNFIIIHGGRNDLSSDGFALNDTFLLELSRFEWIQVELFNDKEQGIVYDRCGHSSLIFGMNNNNYLGSSLFIVHLDYTMSFTKKHPIEEKIEYLEKQEQLFGMDHKEKIQILKKNVPIKRKLSIIENVGLPPIK